MSDYRCRESLSSKTGVHILIPGHPWLILLNLLYHNKNFSHPKSFTLCEHLGFLTVCIAVRLFCVLCWYCMVSRLSIFNCPFDCLKHLFKVCGWFLIFHYAITIMGSDLVIFFLNYRKEWLFNQNQMKWSLILDVFSIL